MASSRETYTRTGFYPSARGIQSGHCPVRLPCLVVRLVLTLSISRHAGYMWSGRAAAWAYSSIDTTGM
jgi:AmmeMemoRadiSam system protein B